MSIRTHILAAVFWGSALLAHSEVAVVNRAISEQEVLAAQQNWCKGLVEVSETYGREGLEAAKERAAAMIDALYGYNLGAVLFKPTLAQAPRTFRPTRAGALSYFVGGDPDYPEDSGFALKGWTAAEPINAAIYIDGDTATTMGKVRLTGADGSVTTVDKTWQFIKDEQGNLRIVVHHSSLEYRAP